MELGNGFRFLIISPFDLLSVAFVRPRASHCISDLLLVGGSVSIRLQSLWKRQNLQSREVHALSDTPRLLSQAEIFKQIIVVDSWRSPIRLCSCPPRKQVSSNCTPARASRYFLSLQNSHFNPEQCIECFEWHCRKCRSGHTTNSITTKGKFIMWIMPCRLSWFRSRLRATVWKLLHGGLPIIARTISNMSSPDCFIASSSYWIATPYSRHIYFISCFNNLYRSLAAELCTALLLSVSSTKMFSLLISTIAAGAVEYSNVSCCYLFKGPVHCPETNCSCFIPFYDYNPSFSNSSTENCQRNSRNLMNVLDSIYRATTLSDFFILNFPCTQCSPDCYLQHLHNPQTYISDAHHHHRKAPFITLELGLFSQVSRFLSCYSVELAVSCQIMQQPEHQICRLPQRFINCITTLNSF